MPVPVFKPFIKRKDMDAVLTCMVSDNLGPGSEADSLVMELIELLDLEAGVALREYPRGIKLAIAALALPESSRIAVCALAPALYEQGIRELGYEPVLVDSVENNPCLDVAAVKVAHERDPFAAVIACSSLGYRPDFEALSSLGLPVIEDCTEAFGFDPSSEDEKRGHGGAVVILGLEPQGIITAGGGVVVFAAGKKEAAQLSKMVESLPPEVYLPDMNAALARSQLREMSGFLERRSEIAEVLVRAAMRGNHRLLHGSRDEAVVPFTFPLLIQSPVSEVQAYARKKNIDTLQAFSASIMHSNQGREDFELRAFPNAYAFLLRCLLFPLYPGLGAKDVVLLEKVVATLP